MELGQMISAVDLDIEQTEFVIDEMNKTVNDYNLNQKRKQLKKKENSSSDNSSQNSNISKKEAKKKDLNIGTTSPSQNEKSINHNDSITTPKFSHYRSINEKIKPETNEKKQKDVTDNEGKESCKMCAIF